MAPKRKYKRGRRAVSFKAASEGLRAAERRIAEQSGIQINALKDLQLQQANIDKLQIKGHADKAAFEEGVQRSKFQLNEMSRDLIVENMNIKADRDVDRLRGIANEYDKKAKHLAQLAPKQAKAYEDVIRGVYDFTEALEYQQLVKDYDKNKGVNYQNNEGYIQSGNILKGNLSAHVNSYEQARKKTLELGEPITNENLIKNGYLPDLERQIDHDRTVGRDNVARGEDVKAHLQENFNAEIAAMRSFIINDLDATLSKVNVEDWYEWGALNYLKRFNISGNSKAGKWVRDKFAAAAQARVVRFTNLDNSKYTAFQINDLSKKLNNTDDPVRQQIYFNKGVLAVKTGTFHDEKRDKFRDGPADLKLAGIEFLKSHVNTHRNRFQSAQDVEDFIAPFVIMDSKTVKLFEDQPVPIGVLAPPVGVPLAKRHPDVLDEITKVWVDGQRLEQQKRNARIPAENGKIEADHDKRWSEHVVNRDRGTDDKGQPYEKTDEQFMRDEIELAGNLNIGDDNGKNYIYNKAGNILGFGGTKRVKEADIINKIQSLELDGRHKDALVAFHSLTPTKRDLVRPAIESYNKLYDSGWDHNGKKGVVGFVAKAKKLLEDIEKGNSNRGNLSDSGTQIKWLMASRVQEKATELINDKKYLGTAKQAIQQAWSDELIEYKKGVNSAEPTKYGTGFYARKRQDYTDDLGEGTWYIYEATDVSSPNSATVSLLNQLKKASDDGTLRNAIEARKLRIEGEHQPETVRMLTKYGKVSYEEWLKDPFLVSPHKVTELAKVAENLADSKMTFLQLAVVPENVKILAHLTGKTDVQVINDLLDQYGHKVRFSGDAQDAARIRADGSYVPKPNIYGQTQFFGARAQGITPMQPWVRMATEEGATAADAFMKSIGVESYFDEKGDLKVTDYAQFFNNNGLSKADISWDQIAPTFGLTGIANIKKLEYQKDILKRLIKSTPSKKR